mmetsp:Transcript_22061/g.46391  ORF Transcript_22061/g.46391 Transcript_22061/m.46391 type:complete len:84 (-) Transcript_22061:1546-1797(-)
MTLRECLKIAIQYLSLRWPFSVFNAYLCVKCNGSRYIHMIRDRITEMHLVHRRSSMASSPLPLPSSTPLKGSIHPLEYHPRKL